MKYYRNISITFLPYVWEGFKSLRPSSATKTSQEDFNLAFKDSTVEIPASLQAGAGIEEVNKTIDLADKALITLEERFNRKNHNFECIIFLGGKYESSIKNIT